MFQPGIVGTAMDTPPSAIGYKRAVERAAPQHFSIDILSPRKIGSSDCYGMRICPIRLDEPDRRSALSGSSEGSSEKTMSEYEIWRKWQDCLIFQDTLEREYDLMARQKRQRLFQHKGVKKDGIYPSEDAVGRHHRAASFVSLPPGPDPNLIAKDVHEFLPKLTKKGTVFRPSPATIEQRQQEFTSLVESFWRLDEDTPALLIELRNMRAVRDFFGYWRQDRDIAEKEKDKGRSLKVPAPASGRSPTIRGSVGMYFLPSTISPHASMISLAPTEPAMKDSKSKAPSTPSSPNVHMSMSIRPRANTEASSSSSSSLSARNAAISVASGRSGHTFSTFITRTPGSPHTTSNYSLNTSPTEDKSMYAQSLAPSMRTAYSSQRSPTSPLAASIYSDKSNGKSRDTFVDRTNQKDEADEDDGASIIFREHAHLMPAVEAEEDYRRGNGSGIDLNIKHLTIHEDYEETAINMPAAVPRMSRRHMTLDAYAFNRQGRVFMSPASSPQASLYDEESAASPPGSSTKSSFSSNSTPTTAYFSAGSSGRTSFTSAGSALPEDARMSFNGSICDPSMDIFEKTRPDRNRVRLSTAPMILHSPASESGFSSGSSQRRRDSMMSTRSFMTTCSADAIIPRNRDQQVISEGSISSGSSKRDRLNRASALSVPGTISYSDDEDEDGDATESNFYESTFSPTSLYKDDSSSDTHHTAIEAQLTPSREHIQYFPAAFQNRPAGQFHLPLSAQPPPVKFIASPVQAPIQPPASPSIASKKAGNGVRDDDLVAIKASVGESIVAFKADRGILLEDVRQKIHDKFVNQQFVPISENFSLAYKTWPQQQQQQHQHLLEVPGSPIGRARSNSVSSVSALVHTQLRYIFSQVEWREAMASCGNKIMLHVLEPK